MVAVSDRDSRGLYDGMVDNLVTQFSSALDCFRELVQNSIDAGTPRVEIWMEYLPGDGHEGTIAIHVDDYGEGMDEAIIDNEFTQLFASTKDEDLTKIGKFGIGFVSVFALEPRAVLVHTGRSGEYWEVLFHEDRSFSKTPIDNPVEGTQITLFIEGEYHRYQELAEEIPATLRHWCSHSDVEITFEDRTNNDDFAPPEVINEEFSVHGECLQRVEHEGTEIVLAYSERPIYGFYNRGLTLALTDVGDDVLTRWKDRFEFIAFKIKSRYLEHTLSRDSVIRDEQYERAMELLEDAANTVLLEALIAELERVVATDQWGVDEYQRYSRLLSFLSTEPVEKLDPFRDRQIFRCLNGPPKSLDDAWEDLRSNGHVLIDREPSPLTEMLGRQAVSVLLGGEPTEISRLGDFRRGIQLPAAQVLIPLLGRIARGTTRGLFWSAAGYVGDLFRRRESTDTERRILNAVTYPHSVYYPIELDEDIDGELSTLLEMAEEILSAAGIGVRRLALGEVNSPEREIPFFVVAPRLSSLMARSTENVIESRRRFEVAVNRNHPHFDVILQAYHREPALGAYLLARGLSLRENYKLDASHELLQKARQLQTA